VNLPGACRNFDFIEVRLAIRGAILHLAFSEANIGRKTPPP
jgi:hypothetical protein